MMKLMIVLLVIFAQIPGFQAQFPDGLLQGGGQLQQLPGGVDLPSFPSSGAIPYSSDGVQLPPGFGGDVLGDVISGDVGDVVGDVISGDVGDVVGDVISGDVGDVVGDVISGDVGDVDLPGVPDVTIPAPTMFAPTVPAPTVPAPTFPPATAPIVPPPTAPTVPPPTTPTTPPTTTPTVPPPTTPTVPSPSSSPIPPSTPSPSSMQSPIGENEDPTCESILEAYLNCTAVDGQNECLEKVGTTVEFLIECGFVDVATEEPESPKVVIYADEKNYPVYSGSISTPTASKKLPKVYGTKN